jgi:hypothetical protein
MKFVSMVVYNFPSWRYAYNVNSLKIIRAILSKIWEKLVKILYQMCRELEGGDVT